MFRASLQLCDLWLEIERDSTYWRVFVPVQESKTTGNFK